MTMANKTADITLAPEQFVALRDLLARYSGVYLDAARQRVLTSGLQQRMEATRLALDAYIALLSQPKGRAELQKLAELTLNHETFFFRNGPHMRALREVILPRLHRQKAPGAPLRIWSAGCSTGEEPYSLAITVLETLGRNLPRPVEIWATDLSEHALAQAQLGRYRGRTLTNVTPELRARYFERQGDHWVVTAPTRSLVEFEMVNLLDPFPPKAQGVDIIFCQNVTIYFQLATCRNLMERFYTALPEGGMLFLGFSETLWNIFDRFRPQEVGGSFVYYKESYTNKEAYSTPIPPVTHPARSESPRPLAQPNANAGLAPRAPSQRRVAALPSSQVQLPRATQGTPPPPPDPGLGPELIQRGRVLLDAGQAAAALDVLCQVPLNGPTAPQVLALIARAHANRGDLDLAVAEARRAIDLDSLTTEAYLLLGILYAQQGQFQAAVQQFERARYLEPGAALVSFHLADAYRQLQRAGPALREYQNVLRKLTNHPPEALLDGVAVSWLRETCHRYINMLNNGQR